MTDWLTDAADLLSEPDPGPTPWLVENLIVDGALVAAVGKWKTTKSYGLLDVCVSVATGEPAFGGLAIPRPGPVIYICEESGRAALWRRLDAICRGRTIPPERLRESLYVAANRGVKLDDEEWQERLIATGRELSARMIVADPLVRMKSAGRDENAQREMAVVIEYLRRLREETAATVVFVHHLGHSGDSMRGSSDLESVWETRLAWKRDVQSPTEVTIESEHREAEAGAPIRYRIAWDGLTRSIRFPLVEGELVPRVRAYLTEHPDASGNEVVEALGTRRKDTLAAVREVRSESVPDGGNYPGTTDPGQGVEAVPPTTPFRGSGTALAQPPSEPVPADRETQVEVETLDEDEILSIFNGGGA